MFRLMHHSARSAIKVLQGKLAMTLLVLAPEVTGN
jgi:hypothetical protein